MFTLQHSIVISHIVNVVQNLVTIHVQVILLITTVCLTVFTQNTKICVVDYDMNSIIYSTLQSVIAKVFTWNNTI